MLQAVKVAVLVVGAVALLGALAWPAFGALWLELEPSAATPGSVVTGRTGGEGAFQSGSGQTFDLFLFSGELSERIWTANEDGVSELPEDPPAEAIPLAELEVDSDGNRFTEFVVPSVAAGKYAVVLHCFGCGVRPGPLAFMAELTVEPDAPRHSLPRTGAGVGPPLFAAVLAVAVGLTVVVASRRWPAER